MSVKKFKFVSPGVFINEIDNSFIPRTPDAIGPVIIGRAPKGLAMQPVKAEAYSDFVSMFGDTVPGGAGGDVYRDGLSTQSPIYGLYGAKAFLAPGVAPPHMSVHLVTSTLMLKQQQLRPSVGRPAGEQRSF